MPTTGSSGFVEVNTSPSKSKGNQRVSRETLKLRLSEEKTTITNARTEEAHFLGTRLNIGKGEAQKIVLTTNHTGKRFKRRSTGWETQMYAPLPKLIQRLKDKGFCTADGKPLDRKGWACLDADQIIALYSASIAAYRTTIGLQTTGETQQNPIYPPILTGQDASAEIQDHRQQGLQTLWQRPEHYYRGQRGKEGPTGQLLPESRLDEKQGGVPGWKAL